MSKLLVIIGSTRPGRSADLVLPWLTSRVRSHDGFDTEIASRLSAALVTTSAPVTTSAED